MIRFREGAQVWANTPLAENLEIPRKDHERRSGYITSSGF